MMMMKTINILCPILMPTFINKLNLFKIVFDFKFKISF
jgi:hypothetical protein